VSLLTSSAVTALNKEMAMEVLASRGCGLDVHQATVVACLLTGEPGKLPRKQVKTFSTMSSGLIELRDWLAAADCTAVATEATGVYWKPVYNILEGHFEVIVANARQIKAVPGRKTDVKDAEWIADLLRHGLLQPSYVPPPELRELRSLCVIGSSWSTPGALSAIVSSSCWRAPTSNSRASFRTPLAKSSFSTQFSWSWHSFCSKITFHSSST
jgi:hypothetical protein